MSKHKLLLADDSITIQKVVNLTFADEGIEVISVGDGNSAMEKFEEMTPDLVMADINMPGLSGYEICERIKSNEATRRIPVILLVGSFEPFDESEAQRVGANDYLTKPFQSIRQLVSKVSDLLNSPPTGDEDFQTPVNSFDDTLRMDEPEELGDAGMDDQMIQASQVGSFQFDETHKFESQSEPEWEDGSDAQPHSSEEFAGDHSYQAQGAADFSGESSSDSSRPEENRELEVAAQTEAFESTPMPERASVLDLDEMDLLELPPRRSFAPSAPPKPAFQDDFVPPVETIEAKTEATPETAENDRSDPNDARQIEPSDTEHSVSAAALPVMGNLSPEIIDQIAAKVVEKISDKVIREIAWEVVPQMTDLIVKRMAEEKLKE